MLEREETREAFIKALEDTSPDWVDSRFEITYEYPGYLHIDVDYIYVSVGEEDNQLVWNEIDSEPSSELAGSVEITDQIAPAALAKKLWIDIINKMRKGVCFECETEVEELCIGGYCHDCCEFITGEVL